MGDLAPISTRPLGVAREAWRRRSDPPLPLGILMDDQNDETRLRGIVRRYELTVCETAYLEVALRRGLPLPTLDRRLGEAAQAIGVAPVQHHDQVARLTAPRERHGA